VKKPVAVHRGELLPVRQAGHRSSRDQVWKVGALKSVGPDVWGVALVAASDRVCGAVDDCAEQPAVAARVATNRSARTIFFTRSSPHLESARVL